MGLIWSGPPESARAERVAVQGGGGGAAALPAECAR